MNDMLNFLKLTISVVVILGVYTVGAVDLDGEAVYTKKPVTLVTVAMRAPHLLQGTHQLPASLKNILFNKLLILNQASVTMAKLSL